MCVRMVCGFPYSLPHLVGGLRLLPFLCGTRIVSMWVRRVLSHLIDIRLLSVTCFAQWSISESDV